MHYSIDPFASSPSERSLLSIVPPFSGMSPNLLLLSITNESVARHTANPFFILLHRPIDRGMERSRANRGASTPATDHNAKTHDYSMFNSPIDGLAYGLGPGPPLRPL